MSLPLPRKGPVIGLEQAMESTVPIYQNRRSFIGGSDARIIMGSDAAALTRLWHEKRGEAEPEDLSGNLVVQLGIATEALNRRWYESNTGQVLTDVQRRFAAAISSENDQGSMNLASKTAPVASTRPSSVAAIQRNAGCRMRNPMAQADSVPTPIRSVTIRC